MKRLLALLVAALLLAACAAEPEQPAADGYAIYYAAVLGADAGGDAIRSDTLVVPGGAEQDTAALAETLVRALLREPDDAALRSPFPGGTSLQKLSVARGRALVDLSPQYERLSGIDLSIADACLTLTLTQIDGIYAVRITVDGRELPYRETQLLTAADALLSSGEDVTRPINVSLYFLDAETGTLRAQAQTLALYEGQTRVSAVFDALRRGPAGDEALRVLLGDGAALASSHIENGVCYVELSGVGEENRALTLDALRLSLLSLDGVDEVRLRIDGEPAEPPQN
jgi:germination protein M